MEDVVVHFPIDPNALHGLRVAIVQQYVGVICIALIRRAARCAVRCEQIGFAVEDVHAVIAVGQSTQHTFALAVAYQTHYFIAEHADRGKRSFNATDRTTVVYTLFHVGRCSGTGGDHRKVVGGDRYALQVQGQGSFFGRKSQSEVLRAVVQQCSGSGYVEHDHFSIAARLVPALIVRKATFHRLEQMAGVELHALLALVAYGAGHITVLCKGANGGTDQKAEYG